MLMVITTLVVAAVFFFVGRRTGIKAAEKQFNAAGPRWYVRPHTEETLREFGLKDDDSVDAPIVVQAGFVRANAPGSNSRFQ